MHMCICLYMYIPKYNLYVYLGRNMFSGLFGVGQLIGVLFPNEDSFPALSILSCL